MKGRGAMTASRGASDEMPHGLGCAREPTLTRRQGVFLQTGNWSRAEGGRSASCSWLGWQLMDSLPPGTVVCPSQLDTHWSSL